MASFNAERDSGERLGADVGEMIEVVPATRHGFTPSARAVVVTRAQKGRLLALA